MPNDIIEGDVIEPKKENIFKRFYHKHESFFNFTYGAGFVLGYIYGIVVLLRTIFDSIRDGNFLAFVISIVFSSFIMILNGLIVGLILGSVFTVIGFIPYLVVRGLKK